MLAIQVSDIGVHRQRRDVAVPDVVRRQDRRTGGASDDGKQRLIQALQRSGPSSAT